MVVESRLISVLCISVLLNVLLLWARGKSYPTLHVLNQAEANNRTLLLSEGSLAETHYHHLSSAYQCSRSEIEYQVHYADMVKCSICDTHTPWYLAQLMLPDAQVFFDVGCNRGYSSAKIFALWSPGDQFNPVSLKENIIKDATANIIKNKNNLDTVCADGFHNLKPLVCMGQHSFDENLPCPARRPIQVYGFDGQRSHVEEMRSTIYGHYPHLKPPNMMQASEQSDDPLVSKVKSFFVYNHAAVTAEAKAGEVGYFTVRDDEGGQLVRGKANLPTAAVPIITLDTFCDENKIDQVDIIKIDAETVDQEVILGATNTLLHRKVKMITMEVDFYKRWAKMFQKLDQKFGFDCYANGEQDLMIRLTQCWDEALTRCDTPSKTCAYGDLGRYPANWVAGNVYCVHRIRAAGLNNLFDRMSLYHFANKSARGDLFVDNSVGFQYGSHRIDAATGQLHLQVSSRSIEDFERNFGRRFKTFDRKEGS